MSSRTAGAPVALIILDGWGVSAPGPGNAVELAHTPTFDALCSAHPCGTMAASGLDVGLPAGQIGNSEVGHLNLGAGRVVYQDLTRIDLAVSDGTFATNSELADACAEAVAGSGTFHLVGLCSTGGVHSHLQHMLAAARAAAAAGVPRVLVHAITDGRDVGPDASLTDLPYVERELADIATEYGGEARIATVIGRYWAMDRDHRWERTKRAWDLIVARVGRPAASATEAARISHEEGITDEFVEPFVIGDTPGAIAHGDSVLFFNFRPDRMRQLVPALTSPTFNGFERSALPDVHALCMTRYSADLDLPTMFEPNDVHDTLADVLEAAGIGQLHVAETEKYAHVTYFFNGGVEAVHAGEERRLADSPRDVATYDLKPEMNARGVADRFVEAMADDHVGFAVLNFANPDMVGHTGVLPAAIAACETADRELARVVDAVAARGGVCLVTADHGNAEVMLTELGTPHTAHTTNPVPLVITLPPDDGRTIREGGRLADIAPTVLELLGLAQPASMTGASLLV